jgi:predicted esterase YcpF (UPF0227 family)
MDAKNKKYLFVYLHGFRSSPQSTKARLTEQALADYRARGWQIEWYAPQLPASPQEAMHLVKAEIAQRHYDVLCIMGSSLGGYYATYLAEQYPAARTSLLNPAVFPARDLERYVGTQTNWHDGSPFEFKPEYVQELEALRVERLTAHERYYLVAATGDEVLDWKEMMMKYPGANQVVIRGGDHAISDYPTYLPEILRFHFFWSYET